MFFLQRYRIFILHIAFWCVYSSFFFYQQNEPRHGEQPVFNEVIIVTLTHVLSMMVISYVNYFYVLPPFLKNKNGQAYILRFLSTFSVFTFIYVHLRRWVEDSFAKERDFFYSNEFTIRVVFSAFFIVMFVCLLKFIEDWFELEARKKELENEKLSTELQFLKAQINPHFLFNTLNNLYYLAFVQSPNTPEVIAKLSQMMRYMIYESNHSKVPLTKEIEYMQNYISLEKLRLNDNFPVAFDVQGNVDTVRITPLILITFLENAFKHGVSNNFSASYVNVNIICENHQCIYTVENTKLPEKYKTVTEKSGIGLKNVQRRLELSYPDKFTLHIDDNSAVFKVQLILNLE